MAGRGKWGEQGAVVGRGVVLNGDGRGWKASKRVPLQERSNQHNKIAQQQPHHKVKNPQGERTGGRAPSAAPQQEQRSKISVEEAKLRNEIAKFTAMLRKASGLPDGGQRLRVKIASLEAELSSFTRPQQQPNRSTGRSEQPPRTSLPSISHGAASGSGRDQAAKPPLPEGWVAKVSGSTGKTYYVNTRTQQSQWHRPKPSDATALPVLSNPRPAAEVNGASANGQNRGSLEAAVLPKAHLKQPSTSKPFGARPGVEKYRCGGASGEAPRGRGSDIAGDRPGRMTVLQNHQLPPMQRPKAARGKRGFSKAAAVPAIGIRAPKIAADAIGKEVDQILHAVPPPPASHVHPTPDRLLVRLLPHQVAALGWCRWREHPEQVVRGGILADDMGLGKTITTLAVVAADTADVGPTLIVCPASLANQWHSEAASRLANAEPWLFHGTSRWRVPFETLGAGAIVVTTYETLVQAQREGGRRQHTPFTVQWHRVVLDEGHLIRNGKTQTFEACRQLEAGSRWVVSGSPLNNDASEMHTLLGRFLRCGALADPGVWRAQIDAAGTLGQQRLRALLGSLLLRRLKSDSAPDGTPLVELPRRVETQHTLTLSQTERDGYRGLLKQGRESIGAGAAMIVRINALRQLCCHPGLVKTAARPEAAEVVDLAASMDRMSLDRTGPRPDSAADPEGPPSSTKLDAIIALTQSLVGTPSPEGPPNKLVIVSQWTGFLELIGEALARIGVPQLRLDGQVVVGQRQGIVERFNSAVGTAETLAPVLLLSLKAGGVGLNLVGANHCLVADLPYNPAVFDQACDRVYRLGQTRAVTIHTFVCAGTVEEWQLRLLRKKRAAMDRVLHDTANVQPTAAEIRELFTDPPAWSRP